MIQTPPPRPPFPPLLKERGPGGEVHILKHKFKNIYYFCTNLIA